MAEQDQPQLNLIRRYWLQILGLLFVVLLFMFYQYEVVKVQNVVQQFRIQQSRQIQQIESRYQQMTALNAAQQQPDQFLDQAKLDVAEIESAYHLDHSALNATLALKALLERWRSTPLAKHHELRTELSQLIAQLQEQPEVQLRAILADSAQISLWMAQQRQGQILVRKDLHLWGVDWSRWLRVRQVDRALSLHTLESASENLASLNWAARVGNEQVYQLNVRLLMAMGQYHALPKGIMTLIHHLAGRHVGYIKMDFSKLQQSLSHLRGTMQVDHDMPAKTQAEKKTILKKEIPVKKLLKLYQKDSKHIEVM